MPTPNDMPGAATDADVEEQNSSDQEPRDEGRSNGRDLPTGDEILADLDNSLDDPKAENERLRKLVRNVRKYEDRARKNAEKARLWDENGEKVKNYDELIASQQTEAQKIEAERDRLRTELETERQNSLRSMVAAELKVPSRFVTGKTETEMRESAQEYLDAREADLEAQLKARGISPAAPASAVTSDGKGNEVKQLTRADISGMSRKQLLEAEKAGQMNDLLGRSR